MRSSSRKASDRSVTSPLDYDLRRLHPFGESVQMWVMAVCHLSSQGRAICPDLRWFLHLSTSR